MKILIHQSSAASYLRTGLSSFLKEERFKSLKNKQKMRMVKLYGLTVS